MKRVEPILFVVTAVLLLVLTDRPLLSAIGVGFVPAILYSFFDECRTRIPIDKLIVAMAAVQWILGPFLAYSGYNDHYKYHMYVEESQYMLLAVPGVLAFWAGFWLLRHRNSDGVFRVSFPWVREIPPRYAYYLIITGVAASFLSSYVPGGLKFFFYLLGLLQYIGVLYLFFGHSKNKYLVLGMSVLAITLSSLKAAMFHDLFLWVVLLSMYLMYYFQITIRQKLVYFLAGASVIFLILVVKADYRQKIWAGAITGQEVSYFSTLVKTQISENKLFSKQNIEGIVVRLNQGWIISRIMEQVPANVRHADGETVWEAAKASLLPRFLNPGKVEAGGRENYTRFTLYVIHETSMGLSLLGEGYANFGIYGAWVFMLCVGLLFGYVFRKLLSLCTQYPSLVLWIPLIFMQVVKAETETLVVLNYLVKAIILTLVVFYGARNFLRWDI